MNRYKTNISLLIAFTLSAIASHATIITVKQDGTGDYTIIQEGIDAAINYDTVLVWSGIYLENVVISNKAIVVASLYLTTGDDWYRYNTIIDGHKSSACFEISGGSDQATVCGFTIRNGSGWQHERGGGIFVDDAEATIIKCIIKDNTARGGGGVWCQEATVFLSGCTIFNNQSISGGGVCCAWDSEITFDTISKCNIYLNYAARGTDYFKTYLAPEQVIVLDTCTILQPDHHFVFSSNQDNSPANDLEIFIDHGYLEPVDHDLYVNPMTGDNGNSGISPQEALKTIAYAIKKVKSDSLNPHSLFLADGKYSASGSGERLPIGSRSYVSLIGESMENCIIDGDSSSDFFNGYGMMSEYSLQNISFINGFGDFWSLILLEWNYNVSIKNISIIDCINNGGALFTSETNLVQINSIFLKNNQVTVPLVIGFCTDYSMNFQIVDCLIDNNKPYIDPNIGEGGGLGIAGNYLSEYSVDGEVINLQLTNNLRIPDPYWGPGMTVGIHQTNFSKVDYINATVGDNILRGQFGFAVNAADGAEMSLYNCILYGDSLKELHVGNPSGANYPSTLNVSFSDIEGGFDNIYIWPGNTLNWLSGNIDADPMWKETGDYPYALKAGSPCINAGTPMYEPGMQPPYIIQQDTVYKLITIDYDTIPLPSTDLAGNPRIAYGRIDMGAYEFADTTTQITNHQSQITNNQINVFPNPFTSNAFISFQTTVKGNVRTAVYNLNGQLVKKLTETEAVPGSCSIAWDGTDSFGFEVNPGTYIVSVEINGQTAGSAKVVKKRRK